MNYYARSSVFVFLLMFALSAGAVNEARLRQRFSQPFQNDGPNCYNTAFIALEYVNETLHMSPREAEFYLKNFCQLKNAAISQVPAGSLFTFYNANSELIHISVALENSQLLEKNTYEGYHRSTPRNEARPGEYIFQDRAQSYYIKNYAPRNLKIFSCAPAQEVHQKLSGLNAKKELQEIQVLRQQLAQDILRVAPQDLAELFRGQALVRLETLRKILLRPPESKLEQDYIRVLSISILHQMDYLVEGAPISCSSCNKKVMRPVQEATRAAEYLLAKNYSGNW